MILCHPHLTTTSLKSEVETKRIAEDLIWSIESFMPDSIDIYKTGEHRTCVELVKEFKFGRY